MANILQEEETKEDLDFNHLVQEEQKKIEQYEKELAIVACFEKLKNNSDFRSIILNDFIKQEPVRIINLKADLRVSKIGIKDLKLEDKLLNERLNCQAIFVAYLANMLTRKQVAEYNIQESLKVIDDINLEKEF